jgi:hypothetical protein
MDGLQKPGSLSAHPATINVAAATLIVADVSANALLGGWVCFFIFRSDHDV